MSKQTAVEWLVEQMKLDELFNADYFIEQAKEMEKQQITDAFEDGNEQGFICKTGEEYYKETFKNE
jgi:DNA polymerase III sliding clamp (beta) subunit (PCNA family)